MELARRLKEHRERLGMSQGDVASAVFVSRQTISNWEHDRTYPDIHSLLLLSDLFGVSIDELVRDDAREIGERLRGESRRMSRLGIAMAALGVAYVAWVVAGLVLDLELAVILVPAAMLFAPAMAAAFMVDRIRHENRLYTYQAVEAFLAGKDPDVDNRFNRRAGEHWVRKRVALTIVAIIIGLCCGWGAADIISRLLG